MKKFIYFLIIILLLLVIAIETPIFLKYNQRKYAIEILKKAQHFTNIKVISTTVNYGETRSDVIKYRTDTAILTEGDEYIYWKSTKTSESYSFWKNDMTCSPEVQSEMTWSVVANTDEINSLLQEDLLELEFKNITYNNKECLEIKENDFNSIYEKETGLLLKEYNDENTYEKINEYEIGNVEKEELIPNLEGYTIYVDVNQKGAFIENLLKFEYLPEDFKNKLKDNQKQILTDYLEYLDTIKNHLEEKDT